MTKPNIGLDSDEVKSWDLPFVEDVRLRDDGKTNAINKRSNWVYEPPEEEPEILPPTAEEIEAIRQAAHEEGYSQGKQAGYEDGEKAGREEGHKAGLEQGLAEGTEQGLAEGKARIDEQTERFQTLMQHLHQPVERVEKQLQDELVKLAVSLARSVVRSEIKTNQDMIFQALSEGLNVLPIQEARYQLHMHPDDIALVKQHFSEQEIDKHHWILVDAEEMTPGGCQIITDSNAVDMTVERRARDVLNRFLLEQGLSEGTEDEPL